VSDLWKGKSGAFNDNGDKDRVKAASDIVRVIGEHVALKPKGREYVGLCPFHDDHKPSMGVVPAKGIFHCFVCGAGGDVISFMQKFHKMEFREALEYLAERAGITLTPRGRQAGGAPEGVSRSDLLTASATASEFFRTILKLDHGKEARAIIERRGISPEMVEKFLLGASPDRWDGLLLTIQNKRLDPKTFAEAGLLKNREGGSGSYDAFRNRLMFPIQDQLGKVIAFGARKIKEEDEPKYLNSPDTRLFSKSKTLYALNHAARAIQAEGTAIITEGYTDVIACHQAGFCNAVATLGTALTREHASGLRRICDRVVLLFDGDDAGQRAADRAVEIFFAEDLDVSICALNRYTDAKDPDELLKRPGGGEVFRAALAGSTELLEKRYARLRDRLEGAGMAALARGLEEELGKLVELGLRDAAPIRQKLIVKRLASVAGLDEATILKSIPAGRKPRVAPPGASGAAPELGSDSDGAPIASEEQVPPLHTATLTAAEHMLGCILCDGRLLATLSEHERDFIGPEAYRWRLLSRVAQTVHDLGEDGATPDLAGLLRNVEDLAVKDAAVGLAARIDQETDRDTDRLHAHWRACLVRARQDYDARPRKTGTGTSPDIESVLTQIKLKRTAHASLGADRRVLPKPG
jgi:DNA primase